MGNDNDILHASREQIAEIQLAGIQKTVIDVYEHIPFYKKSFDEAGFDPYSVKSLDDVARIPFVQKQDLRDAYPYGMLAVPLKDVREIHMSSGTTGIATVGAYTEHDIKIWGECFSRAVDFAHGDENDIMQICYGYGLFTGGLGAHYGSISAGCATIPISAGNTERQIRILREMGSTILCCTPSYAMHIADTAIAMGIDPAKAHIFIQSMVPELTELSFYYMNLVTVSRLQRNPTVKSEIQMRNFETSIPVGFFCYPISQAADITAFKADTVPVGEDQEPMIEQTREIVRKFNSTYAPVLVEPEILLPEQCVCRRLPGTDGRAKMSKSLGNCIYLSDEPEDIKKKIMSMYTDPNHLRVQDPGKVEGNPVFIYLDAFCRPEHFAEFWPEYQNLDELKAHYQRGGLGDVKVKKFLNSVMQAELEPIRTRRKEWEQRLPEVVEILKEGSAYAEKTAAATLDEVRKAMRIDYFENDNLLK